MDSKSHLLVGLFTDDDKLDMKIKKNIYLLTVVGVLEAMQSEAGNKIMEERYNVFLKLFNKFSDGKSKKYPKD